MTTDLVNIEVKQIAESRISSVDFDNVQFGKSFSDHMFVVDYVDGKWQNAQVVPYADIKLSPANSALHYGQSIFEGLKAYKSDNGDILIFRPQANWKRFNESAERMCMPTISEELFLNGLSTLVNLDKDWIPNRPGYSMYIRPFMFATDDYIGVRPSLTYKFIIFTCPVGAYYSTPVKVKIENHYARSFEGGIGFAKAAANYGAAMYPTLLAQKEGFDQLIWTDGKEHKYVEESGTMNVMFVINGKLITAPTTETILKGVTRDSVIQLAKDWGVPVEERKVAVSEIIEAAKNGTLQEAFGAGTAATIAHIALIHHEGTDYPLSEVSKREFSNRVLAELDGIKTGRIADKHGWAYKA